MLDGATLSYDIIGLKQNIFVNKFCFQLTSIFYKILVFFYYIYE